ncbi:MAG: hypothetical protein WCO30_00735 [bacterium]
MSNKFISACLAIINVLIKKLGGAGVVSNSVHNRDTGEMITKTVSFLTATSKQTVNYNRSVEGLHDAGKYSWPNGDITDKNFSSGHMVNPTEIGKKKVEFGLFHFRKEMEYHNEVIAKMKLEGFRPATIKELLNYGKKNPKVQCKFTIVALGSVATLNDNGYRGSECWGYLGEHGEGNRVVGLMFDTGSGGWSKYYRFLAVRILPADNCLTLDSCLLRIRPLES